MSAAVDRYLATAQVLAELRARENFDEAEEDALLDVLDDIWRDMTAEETEELERRRP
jgi:hypothetical protein